MTRPDYARNDWRDTAPWYTPLIYMMSMAVMAYALIWLATAFVEKADCWSSVDSTGCAVVWTP